jgi:hypothetical protein
MSLHANTQTAPIKFKTCLAGMRFHGPEVTSNATLHPSTNRERLCMQRPNGYQLLSHGSTTRTVPPLAGCPALLRCMLLDSHQMPPMCMICLPTDCQALMHLQQEHPWCLQCCQKP